MWFDVDGKTLCFTHITKRARFRNLQHDPSMSLAASGTAIPISRRRRTTPTASSW